MLWTLKVLQRIEAVTGLRPPESFIQAINSYHNPERLLGLGLIVEDEDAGPSMWESCSPFDDDGFLNFMHFDSNWFQVGCVGDLSGVVSVSGVSYTGGAGGFCHLNANSFLEMLDRTADHDDADVFPAFADLTECDVITDEKVMAAVDAIIQGKIARGKTDSLSYFLSASSESMAIRLLSNSDFLVQEAAANRLGELGSVQAVDALTELATVQIAEGYVNQHVNAARRALRMISDRG